MDLSPFAHHWDVDCHLHSKADLQSGLLKETVEGTQQMSRGGGSVSDLMGHHHHLRFAAFCDHGQSRVGLQAEGQQVFEVDWVQQGLSLVLQPEQWCQ